MQTACFEALRQLRSVRRSLSNDVLLTLLRALVVSEKVDCYSTVLAGIYESLLDRLQSVLNATDRLVFSARRSEHVTPLLRDLHWLKVPERIKFRLCVLTHRTWRNVHGTAPPTLPRRSNWLTDMSTRRHLRSTATPTLVVPSTSRTTLGDRAFPVAAARTWNAILFWLRAVLSQKSFRRRFKTELQNCSTRLFLMTVYSPRSSCITITRVFVYNFNFVQCPCKQLAVL